MSNIQTINFNNQQLLTVEKDGIRYVAVKPICENLGLDWASQFTKIKNNLVLNEGIVIITTPSEGGPQQTVCLPINMINGWLFTINPNRVSEEIKPLVIYYQKECYRALFEFWNKTKKKSHLEATMEVIAELIEQEKRIAFIESEQTEIKQEFKEIKAKQEALTDNSNFFSVLAFANLHNLGLTNAKLSALSRKAGKLSKQTGEAVGTISDPRWGKVKTYHKNTLTALFKEENLI